MTFQELLYKTRGRNSWRPPDRLWAVDPGGTIGVAHFTFDKLGLVMQSKEHSEFISLIANEKPNVIVCEDYRIYPDKLSSHTMSNIPTVKIIGAIEYICQLHNIKLIKQMASVAKGFCTNDKLKDWGFYQKGVPHAMDAVRHGCHALLFNKEL